MRTTSIAILLTAISFAALQLVPQITASRSLYSKYGYVRSPADNRYFCWRCIFGPVINTRLTKRTFYIKIRAYERCVKFCSRRRSIKRKPLIWRKDYIAELFRKKPYFIYRIKVPAAYRKRARFYIRYFRLSLRRVFGRTRFYCKRWYTKSNELKLRRYLALYLKRLAVKPRYRPSKPHQYPSWYHSKCYRRAGLRRQRRGALKKRSSSRSKPRVYKYSGRRNRKWQTEIYQISVPAGYRYKKNAYLKWAKYCYKRVFGTQSRRGYRKNVFYCKIRSYEKCLKKCLKQHGIQPKKVGRRKGFIGKLFKKKPRKITKTQVRRQRKGALKKRSFSRSKPRVYKYSGKRNSKWQTEIYQISVPAGYRYKKNAYLKWAKFCWKRTFSKKSCKGYKKNVFYLKIRSYEKCLKKCLIQHGIKPKKVVRRKDFIAKLFNKKPRKITKIQVPAKYRKYAKYYIRYFKRALAHVSGKRRYYSKRCYTKRKEIKFRKECLNQLVHKPWYKPSFIFNEPVYYFFGDITK